MIKNHTELLNALIEKYNLKSYLEIGVQNPANNFDKIRCAFKSGCDPDVKDDTRLISDITSDEFFKRVIETDAVPYDLIFIDGLHHADQVKRDFENSLRCLSDNGFIVIHDVLPENEAGTIVPRETKQWWGDVYKWAMNIGSYDNIGFKTFNIDNGCMLVWNQITGENYNGLINNPNWHDYLSYRDKLMNVTDEVII